MERVAPRIAQAYGYAVCFITVVVMLISIKSVVDSAFDLTDPLRAEGSRMGRTLTNFELYKIEARQGVSGDLLMPVKGAGDTVSTDADLKRAYDAEREAAIGNAHFRALRSLVGSLLLIVIALILFVIHWRWLRKRDTAMATAAA